MSSSEQARPAFGLGWRLVFLAGVFPAVAGLSILALALYSATAGYDRPWLSLAGVHTFTAASMKQQMPELAPLWLLMVHMLGVNLAMSGVTICVVSWFALRQGHHWAWGFLWVAVLWVGVNDAAALLIYRNTTGSGVPIAVIPLALGTLGLLRHRAEQNWLWAPGIADPPEFRDQRFLEPGDWVTFSDAEGFTHRYLRGSPILFCETIMTARGNPADAIELFRGAWDWWDRGRVPLFETLADGSTSQIMIPVAWHYVHVRMRMLPAVENPETGGWRVPGKISGSFNGTISFDVIPGLEPGRLSVRGRFHGIREEIIAPREFITLSHLRAESGTLGLPFPRGTGWPGVRRRLRGASHGRFGVRGHAFTVMAVFISGARMVRVLTE